MRDENGQGIVENIVEDIILEVVRAGGRAGLERLYTHVRAGGWGPSDLERALKRLITNGILDMHKAWPLDTYFTERIERG